jgi:inhibitor of KinA
VEIRPAGDRSLLVSFGAEISLETHERVLRLMGRLAARRGIVNLHPAYASVLVDFDPLRTNVAQMERALREAAEEADRAPLPEPRTVEVPVHYGGPDLDGVARRAGLTPEEIIALHSGAEYVVYFLGFSPGFPYLGGMPEAIAAPRLAVPRRHVPAGSVAIGGSQTGIYPVASPGGWRIIGRTPLELFRADREPPALLAMGDRVRFVRL